MLYTLEELEELQQLADRVDIPLIDLLRFKGHLMSGKTTPKSSSRGYASSEDTSRFCRLTPATSSKGVSSTENSPPRSSVVQSDNPGNSDQRTSPPHAGFHQESSLLQPEMEEAFQWHSTRISTPPEVPTQLPPLCNDEQTVPASNDLSLLDSSVWNLDAMFSQWPMMYAPACDTTMEPYPVPELGKSPPSHVSSTATSRTKHHIDAEVVRSAKKQRLNSHRFPSSRQHPSMGAPSKVIQKSTPERACIRCSIQHVECKSNPSDPRGCCERCTNPRLKIQLPCLRYRITDAVLYRPGSSLPVYHDFDFTGPNAGSLPYAEPVAGSDAWIWLAQPDQSPMKIRLCRFQVPAQQLHAIPSHKEPLYEHRYMVADAGEAAEANLEYVTKHASALARNGVGVRGGIYWRVFDAAFKMADSHPLLYEVLRLWSSCRLMEGGWNILSKNDIGFKVNRPMPSPLLNAQLHAVEATKVIGPLTESVMGRLEKLMTANKKEHFYEVFLCTFILLHNYEKMVARQRSVAIKREAKVVYTNMPYIRAIQVGSKALLAYFHYNCKGFMLFQADFDMSAARTLAKLTEDQAGVLQAVRDFAVADKERLTRLSHTDQYHQPDWFISQLFDSAWKPRATWEHAPHVEAWQ